MKINLPILIRTTLLVVVTFGISACSSLHQPSAPGESTARTRSHRTGLGTAAGYERGDSVYDVAFHRKSPSHPDAIASFHYNDKAGAEAMVAMLGGRTRLHSGSFMLAGDRIEASMEPFYGSKMEWMEADGKVIVVGQPGSPYLIRLKNRANTEIEVVVSVDGLDVITSKAANFSNRGYVIPPKSSITIEGFRKNADSVRSFLFSRVDESQAMKKGGEAAARNVGVIGVAIFEQDRYATQAAKVKEGGIRQGAMAFPNAP